MTVPVDDSARRLGGQAAPTDEDGHLSHGGHNAASLTDRELVLAFQAGSPSAYSEIYRRHRRQAERVCRHHLRGAEAEDAVQETMLRVLQGLPTFNGSYALGAWIHRIATNVCIDWARKRGRRNGDERLEFTNEEEQFGRVVDVSEAVQSLLDAEAVQAALSDLPYSYRQALVLRAIEGRSHIEIAAVLGISAGQAKALIHRARSRLRRNWRGQRLAPGALLFPAVLRERLARLLGRLTQPSHEVLGVAASPPVVESVAAASRVGGAVVAALVAATVGVGAISTRSTPRPTADPGMSVVAGPTDPSGQRNVGASLSPGGEPAVLGGHEVTGRAVGDSPGAADRPPVLPLAAEILGQAGPARETTTAMPAIGGNTPAVSLPPRATARAPAGEPVPLVSAGAPAPSRTLEEAAPIADPAPRPAAEVPAPSANPANAVAPPAAPPAPLPGSSPHPPDATSGSPVVPEGQSGSPVPVPPGPEQPAAKGPEGAPGQAKADEPKAKGPEDAPGQAKADEPKAKGPEDAPGQAKADEPKAKGPEDAPGQAKADEPKAKGPRALRARPSVPEPGCCT